MAKSKDGTEFEHEEQRRLFKQGGSVSLTLPHGWVDILQENASKGYETDRVDVLWDESKAKLEVWARLKESAKEEGEGEARARVTEGIAGLETAQ